LEDPRGFLASHRGGAILDEVQRAPDLLSYLQGEVDERPEPGRFVLTGSANFALLKSVSQSLAGRTALLHLLPLSLEEIRSFGPVPDDFFAGLDILERLAPACRPWRKMVVYGGRERQERFRGLVLPWAEIDEFDWMGAKKAEG